MPVCAISQTDAPAKELPMISAGVGICGFKGDVGKESGFQTSLRPGFYFGAEQRFGNFAGVGLNLVSGSLGSADRSQTINRNFRSSLLQAGLNGIFYFDNDAIIKRSSQVAPWISAGLSWTKFDPYGDLTDANGQKYYYWTDGSIRDLPETAANEPFSVMLHRDYSYETQLKDSLKNYTRSTFSVPLGAGLRFKFGGNFSADIGFRYTITFSDYLDNVADGGNDSWMFFSAGLNYKFTRNDKRSDNSRYKDVDFTSIDNQDYDADGVPDKNDECQGTPKNVKVDSKGCPLDGDMDGVPDYRDLEANTPKGVTVDENGMSLEAGEVKDINRDSLIAARKQQFGDEPSKETLDKISGDASAQKTGNTIPEQFRAADLNHDGFISADEITRVIDFFFDGEGDWTAEKINRLIDYFFEQ